MMLKIKQEAPELDPIDAFLAKVTRDYNDSPRVLLTEFCAWLESTGEELGRCIVCERAFKPRKKGSGEA